MLGHYWDITGTLPGQCWNTAETLQGHCLDTVSYWTPLGHCLGRLGHHLDTAETPLGHYLDTIRTPLGNYKDTTGIPQERYWGITGTLPGHYLDTLETTQNDLESATIDSKSSGPVASQWWTGIDPAMS